MTKHVQDPIARRVSALALGRVDMAFAARPEAPPPEGVQAHELAGIDPALEAVRRPLQVVDLYEGIVIEGAIGIALDASPRYRFLGKGVFPVTEADRGLVERNAHADLALIEPPAPGEALGNSEIDILAYDRETQTLLMIDVKRSFSVGEAALTARLGQASLSARRAAKREGLQFARTKIVKVRWFGERRTAHGAVGRRQVDAALGVPVRYGVDLAVQTYRRAFSGRMRELLAGLRLDAAPGPRAAPEIAAGRAAPATSAARGLIEREIDRHVDSFSRRVRAVLAGATLAADPAAEAPAGGEDGSERPEDPDESSALERFAEAIRTRRDP